MMATAKDDWLECPIKVLKLYGKHNIFVSKQNNGTADDFDVPKM